MISNETVMAFAVFFSFYLIIKAFIVKAAAKPLAEKKETKDLEHLLKQVTEELD